MADVLNIKLHSMQKLALDTPRASWEPLLKAWQLPAGRTSLLDSDM
jgi:hypothetical protein